MMRKALFALLAIGAVASAAIPDTALAQNGQVMCWPSLPCVPAPQRLYNRCFSLALRRGLTVSRGDSRNLNWFIYQCLAGRIPR